MSLINSLDKFCSCHELLPHASTIILGLSGGPDSMMLLEYLSTKHHEGSIKLIAAHLDHQWRANSQDDVKFCQIQTEKRQVKLIVAKASEIVYKSKFNGSQEDLGRKLRRSFLERTAQELGAHAIALAHNMNDQQETFFIRLLRGSSLTGLTAMKPYQDGYIRPLLETSRTAIMNYIDNHSIEYLTDPTNESDLYLRNRIRKYVLPSLRLADSRFDQSFSRTLGHLQDTENFLDRITQDILKNCSIDYSGSSALKIDTLITLHTVLIKRVLLAWLIHENVPFEPSERFFQEIFRFISNKGISHRVNPHWLLRKKRGLIFIER